MGLKIALYSMGSAFKFKKKNLKRADGTMEYYILTKLLCHKENIDELILLSRNNFNELSEDEKREIDPRGIIKNPWVDLPVLAKRPADRSKAERFAHCERFSKAIMDNYTIDFGIGFMSQGYATVTTQPGFLNTVTAPHKPAECLDMCLYYASTIVNYLNKSNLPWFLLATDPRYIKPKVHYRDTSNLPRLILGQHDLTVNWKSLEEFKRDSPIIVRQVEAKYTGIEKAVIIGKEKTDPSNARSIKFALMAMQLTPQSSKKDLRYNILKEYVFPIGGDIRIFGKWSDYFKNQSHSNYFKGYLSNEDIDETFINTRYTLVVPTDAGWVTSKYAEQLQWGVVPFFHPLYDKQYHLVPEDHFIRLKSADDFKEKIEYLENNPDERIKLVKNLQNELISDTFNGDFMINILNKALNDCGINKKISLAVDDTRIVNTKALF
jgi:hypothetical protein